MFIMLVFSFYNHFSCISAASKHNKISNGGNLVSMLRLLDFEANADHFRMEKGRVIGKDTSETIT